MSKDKTVLLTVGDGPEGIELYTSTEEAVVDMAECVPALYLVASINGAQIKLGPFMKSIRDQVELMLR